jgi:PIN domain nuclease of toxin-antitoxin system
VVDASALLAYLFGERGADRFVSVIGSWPAMSAVNWSEVRQKCVSRGVDGDELRQRVFDAGLHVVELTVDGAERIADLWPVTHSRGLSLADRACLALAIQVRRPAVTADQAWTQLSVDGLVVHSLR